MKIFNILILIILSGCATKNNQLDYTLKDWIFSPFARIQIAPTFEKPIEYELMQHEPYLLYSEYGGRGGYNWGKKEKTIRITLTKEQHAKAIKLLEDCLATLPQSDRTLGLDGTTWVLEASSFQYLKTIIWEPEIEAVERGYSGLLELGNYLNQIVIESEK